MSGAKPQDMLMPSIERYMTQRPYSISSGESMATARTVMDQHAIRHLPVVEGERLVGVISDRDVALLGAVPGVDLDHVEIARVMSPPVDVRRDTPLDEVSDLMSTHRTDCVVVRSGDGVEGIFTAVDALHALSDLLRRAAA